MHCPKCGHDLREIEYESARIGTCDCCGGELLRADAMRAIVRRREQRFPPQLRLSLGGQAPIFGLPKAEAARSLTCPTCRGGMQAMNYGGDSGVIIDRCDGCGTMFLDHEELEKIQMLMERFEDEAPAQIRAIAADLERTRRETAESTSRAFAGSRFAFVNAVINRLLDAA